MAVAYGKARDKKVKFLLPVYQTKGEDNGTTTNRAEARE